MAGIVAPKAKKDKIVSCAECRRLKLKCDRNFPCSSCRKRGLGALCPNVALPTRPRYGHHYSACDPHSSLPAPSRSKPPSDDAKNGSSASAMTSRIRELEDALRSLHGLHSPDPHPLLANEYSATNHAPLEGPSDSKHGPPDSPAEEDVDKLDESLGTLTIDPQSGNSSFFGQSAGMESLYQTELRAEVEESKTQLGWSSEPFDPLRDYAAYPLYPRLSNDVVMQHLEGHLPDPLRAWALCDFYFRHAGWLYAPILRQQFQDEILLPVYSQNPPSLRDTSLTQFEVSILFMVFAIGSLLDLSTPANPRNYNEPHPDTTPQTSSDPELYHQLARTALTAGASVIDEPSISGVRVLFFMAFYHMLLDNEKTPQISWSLTSMAVGLAVSIGLHRDSERWKLDPAVVNERRALFWELSLFLSFEVCLAFGRPPQITMPFVDCEIKPDTEQSIGPDGTIIHGYHHRMHIMAATIMSDVRDLVLSTKQKYTDILALDRKLRDSAIELFGGPVGDRQAISLKRDSTETTMQGFFLLAIKETFMLYIHRKYFVRACMCRPEDLATSRYYPSLLAAFRSAQKIISLLDDLLAVEPILPCRLWFFWNHTLASAIMVGSVAMRHPRSVLATEAMSSLERVSVELQQACMNNQNSRVDRPRRALKIVTRLREKAHIAMSQLEYTPTEADIRRQDEELKMLGGHTRVVSTRLPSYLATAQSSPSVDTPSSTDVHPSLMEDLAVVMQQDQDAWISRERERKVASSNTSTTMTGTGPSEISSRQSMRIDVFPGEVHNAGQSSYSTAAHGCVAVGPLGQAPNMERAHVHMHGGHSVGVGGDTSQSDAVAYAGYQVPSGSGGGEPSAVYGHGVTAIDGFGESFVIGDTPQEVGTVGAGIGGGGNATVNGTGSMQDSSWNPMSMMMSDDYPDVGWQGFVAQLGVSGG